MNKFVTYIKESWEEVRDNVTWTPTNELLNTTVLVLIATIIFALAIMGIDNVFTKAMQMLYSL